jgi:hypothetical protein
MHSQHSKQGHPGNVFIGIKWQDIKAACNSGEAVAGDGEGAHHHHASPQLFAVHWGFKQLLLFFHSHLFLYVKVCHCAIGLLSDYYTTQCGLHSDMHVSASPPFFHSALLCVQAILHLHV